MKAEHIKGRPPFIPTVNHRGSRKAGLVYEKKVADTLKGLLGAERVLHGPWFKYEMEGKIKWCSPDLIILPTKKNPFMIIGECKLTARLLAAKLKLKHTYAPVCMTAFDIQNVRMVQIAKHLSKKWNPSEMTICGWTGGSHEIFKDDIDWDYITWVWRI